MERKDGTRTLNNSGDGERGPGWYDVYCRLAELQVRCAGRLRPYISPTKAAYPKWGLRVVIRLVGVREPIAYYGYGNAYISGAKTLAAAYFLALVRAEEWLDAAGIDYRDAELP